MSLDNTNRFDMDRLATRLYANGLEANNYWSTLYATGYE